MYSNQKESKDVRHRQVLDNLSTEILRVCMIVNKRNKLHRTRSEASNLTKEKDAYEDLLPRIVNLGEEIQLLQKTKSELSRFAKKTKTAYNIYICTISYNWFAPVVVFLYFSFC